LGAEAISLMPSAGVARADVRRGAATAGLVVVRRRGRNRDRGGPVGQVAAAARAGGAAGGGGGSRSRIIWGPRSTRGPVGLGRDDRPWGGRGSLSKAARRRGGLRTRGPRRAEQNMAGDEPARNERRGCVAIGHPSSLSFPRIRSFQASSSAPQPRPQKRHPPDHGRATGRGRDTRDAESKASMFLAILLRARGFALGDAEATRT